MALDKQCPFIDWHDDHDYVLSEKDIDFAKLNGLKKTQMRRFMSVFEKIVNFKSDGLSFRDMNQKIEQMLPDFEAK